MLDVLLTSGLCFFLDECIYFHITLYISVYCHIDTYFQGTDQTLAVRISSLYCNFVMDGFLFKSWDSFSSVDRTGLHEVNFDVTYM